MAKVTIVVRDLDTPGDVALEAAFDPPPERPATRENLTAAQVMGANLAGMAMEWMKKHGEPLSISSLSSDSDDYYTEIDWDTDVIDVDEVGEDDGGGGSSGLPN